MGWVAGKGQAGGGWDVWDEGDGVGCWMKMETILIPEWGVGTCSGGGTERHTWAQASGYTWTKPCREHLGTLATRWYLPRNMTHI